MKAVIWPESAVNFLLERDDTLRHLLAHAIPPNGVLLTGAPRGEPKDGPIAEVWNSFAMIDTGGEIIGTADKFHLVPLGEYVPLRGIFPFINKITPGDMNFSANVYYSSRVPFAPDLSTSQEAYALLNLSANWTSPDSAAGTTVGSG